MLRSLRFNRRLLFLYQLYYCLHLSLYSSYFPGFLPDLTGSFPVKLRGIPRNDIFRCLSVGLRTDFPPWMRTLPSGSPFSPHGLQLKHSIFMPPDALPHSSLPGNSSFRKSRKRRFLFPPTNAIIPYFIESLSDWNEPSAFFFFPPTPSPLLSTVQRIRQSISIFWGPKSKARIQRFRVADL